VSETAAPARPLILASSSPRRADLLRQAGIPFTLRLAEVDETPRPGEEPGAIAERLARAKAAAPSGLPSPALLIAADTLVVVDGAVLGKPRDAADAMAMLRRLAGRAHEVITAVALRAVPEESVTCERTTSLVRFAPLSDRQIEWYVKTGEGADKAGAYALQGRGGLLVTAVEGSYTNVIGLPLDRLYPHLRRFGILP